MRWKGLSFVLVLIILAVSLGYGLGRGFRPQPLEIDAVVETSMPAANAAINAELANIFVEISKKMIPSVVNIFTTSTVRSPWGGRGQDELWRKFFEEFFGEEFGGVPGGPGGPGGPAPKAQSLGSGFVIEAADGEGIILTNNHVVEGADEISIKFTEEVVEKETKAELIGRDPILDIAILKVTTKRKLQPVVMADSDKLQVGEWVAALGNPFGHGHSVSHGIVSAKERTLPGSFGNYVQVDAPINPGNSGGPLVNLNGQVVGINNAIDARGPGIGFAIPINAVKAVLPQLKEKGKVERGYIGVSVDELRPDLAKTLKLDENTKAPIITHVLPGQPAGKAGVQVYDVVTEVNGKAVHTTTDLVDAIATIPVGDKAKLKLIRSGKEQTVEVPVAKRPESKLDRQPKRPEPQVRPQKGRPETGLRLEQIDPEIAGELGLPETYSGVVIAQVMPGSAAFNAGLARGDVVLEVDRKPVKTVEQFYKTVREKKTYLLRVRKIDETGKELFAVVALDLAAKKE